MKKKPENCGDIRKFIGIKGKGSTLGGSPSRSAQTPRPTVSAGVKDVHGKSFMKENTPTFPARKKSNTSGGGNLSANVHGLAGAATGTVKQVDVNNASKANVHGFGGGSPARKKPRHGPREASTARSGGTVAGKPAGSFGLGTGLAFRNAGSKTVTVKGKTATKSEVRVEDGKGAESATTPTTLSFQGRGFTLGGSSAGASRLLSLSNSIQSSNTPAAFNSKTRNADYSSDEEPHNSERKDQKSNGKKSWISRSPTKGKSPGQTDSPNYKKLLDNYVVSSPHKESYQGAGDSVQCPVCDKAVNFRMYTHHLNECVGDFEDEDEWDVLQYEQKNLTKTNSALHSIEKKQELTISDDEDSDGQIRGAAGGSSSVSKVTSKPETEAVIIDFEEELYPCPVCNDLFSQLNINQHLDTHF